MSIRCYGDPNSPNWSVGDWFVDRSQWKRWAGQGSLRFEDIRLQFVSLSISGAQKLEGAHSLEILFWTKLNVGWILYFEKKNLVDDLLFYGNRWILSHLDDANLKIYVNCCVVVRLCVFPRFSKKVKFCSCTQLSKTILQYSSTTFRTKVQMNWFLPVLLNLRFFERWSLFCKYKLIFTLD